MKLVITEHARRSLLVHFVFLAESSSIDHAERVIQKVDEAMNYLAGHPGAGQFEDQLVEFEPRHGRWVVDHYKIIYQVFEDQLVITDIFDSRQDPRKMKG
jgi:plasmid stabilization system protein ParE